MSFAIHENFVLPGYRTIQNCIFFMFQQDGYAIKEVNFKRSKRLYLKQNPTEIPQDDVSATYIVHVKNVVMQKYQFKAVQLALMSLIINDHFII